ncbi:MAG: SurA N-terminal domain-containing protein [Candidatus Omnitrophota bacterium]
MSLKFFRLNMKIIIWITIVALVLLFGAGSIVDIVHSDKSGRYAGEAFGKPVTFQEFNKFFRATELFMPVGDRSTLNDPDLLRSFTWQNIVYAREARNVGITVSDGEVREQITKIMAQQGLSNPTPEQYRVWLTRNLQINPREFEEGLREFMKIQKLLGQQLSDLPTDQPVEEETEKNAETPKPTDEETLQKRQMAFMIWTHELNQKADVKDYLALPEETPESEVPATSPDETHPVSEKVQKEKIENEADRR